MRNAPGLHEREFIETRRHWFTGVVPHHTNGGVNVLNLVEGEEAIVESPENRSIRSWCTTLRLSSCRRRLAAITRFVRGESQKASSARRLEPT